MLPAEDQRVGLVTLLLAADADNGILNSTNNTDQQKLPYNLPQLQFRRGRELLSYCVSFITIITIIIDMMKVILKVILYQNNYLHPTYVPLNSLSGLCSQSLDP